MILGLTDRILVLDAETASPVDLRKFGTARYFAHPKTKTLMLGHQFLDSPASCAVTDFETGDVLDLPTSVLSAIHAPPEECMLAAANAPFDQEALRKLGIDTPDSKWLDVLTTAYYLGFSGRLNDVLKQVFAGENVVKDPEGTRLITYFSVQMHPWHEAPDKWQRFRNYCQQDVNVEARLLQWCLDHISPSAGLSEQYRRVFRQELIYRKINRRGIPVDAQAVEGAKKIRDAEMTYLKQRLRDITGLDNPNSRDQLLRWCNEQFGRTTLLNLTKDHVRDTLAWMKASGDEASPVYEALELRQELGKTSNTKYDALARVTSPEDSRLRNGWQFYGASRTGRVAGRVLNPANLPRPNHPSPEGVAELMSLGDPDILSAFYPQMPLMPTLGMAIRASLKAPEGKVWCVADLSSIETVGAAWLSGCQTVLDVFHEGRDVYKTFAADSTGLTYDEITKAQRTLYKPAVLGGIYQLSGNGLLGYAESMGVNMTREQAVEQIAHLRDGWHEIPHYWRQLQDAVSFAMNNPGRFGFARAVDSVVTEYVDDWGRTRRLYSYKDWPRVSYFRGKDFLYCVLPSGRMLCYYRPSIEPVTIYRDEDEGGSFTVNSLHYYGNDQKATGAKWQQINAHGGSLLENINQAFCRDALWNGLEDAEADDRFEVVGDVYDELLTLVDRARAEECLSALIGYMTTRPPWLDENFFLSAAGYTAERYRKD